MHIHIGGPVSVFSAYEWPRQMRRGEQGWPEDGRFWTGPPRTEGGGIAPVNCSVPAGEDMTPAFNDDGTRWLCEHRHPAVAAMPHWRREVANAAGSNARPSPSPSPSPLAPRPRPRPRTLALTLAFTLALALSASSPAAPPRCSSPHPGPPSSRESAPSPTPATPSPPNAPAASTCATAASSCRRTTSASSSLRTRVVWCATIGRWGRVACGDASHRRIPCG